VLASDFCSVFCILASGFCFGKDLFMLQYGPVYAVIMVLVLIAVISDLGGIVYNVFFRRDFLNNYARYGISVIKLVIYAILFTYMVLVLTSVVLTTAMFIIHLICAVLIFIDFSACVILKIRLKVTKK
jgi:hypothetical protein